jgi:hypothetical protein
MKTDRRSFIKVTGIAGTGMIASGMTNYDDNRSVIANTGKAAQKTHTQFFNMCGYAAPKIEKVRIGMIGIGNRGLAAVDRLKHIEGVEIKALCDKRSECVELGQKSLGDAGLPLDQDAYDAALWSSIVPLSEWSVAHGSNPIDVPDFTCGSYKTNTPVDITLSKGGNTGVR